MLDRFGVAQRAALLQDVSPVPHVLSLGATPIPRTLQMMQTGDLSFYVIDEMPPGRQAVHTEAVLNTESDIAEVCIATILYTPSLLAVFWGDCIANMLAEIMGD